MKIDILTLFPEMCEAVLNESIIGRARKTGKVELDCVNIRDFAFNKHNKVDDAPFGGGMGMIMACEPIYQCYLSRVEPGKEKPHVIYLSPKGRVFTQKIARELLQYDHLIFLCGHYEGVDERILDEIVDEEISAGDYVLTGGELPALLCADAVCRMLPGVLSDDSCFTEESHYSGLLEYPQFTRPASWHNMEVPEVLLSGNHAEIAKWRRQKSIAETARRRPDMLKTADLTDQEKAWLAQIPVPEGKK